MRCLIIINDWNENGIDITTRSASVWAFPVSKCSIPRHSSSTFMNYSRSPLVQGISVAIPFKGYLIGMIAGVVLSNVVGDSLGTLYENNR